METKSDKNPKAALQDIETEDKCIPISTRFDLE